MPTGQKHLIKCQCILLQFKRMPNPPSHQFLVFSVIDDDGSVRVKFSQCPNCSRIHKVVDICRSEVVTNKETMSSIIGIDDIRVSMHRDLASILDTNRADLPTWEAVQFFYDNKQWGSFVVLSSDAEADMKQGKYLRLLGENLFKVDSFVREDIIR